MMRRFFVIINFCIIALTPILSLSGCDENKPSKPRVAILIVVDQFSEVLLTKYEKHLTGGLRRLLSEGAYFKNTFHDHAISNSAAGHATINTGSYPKNHGIVDNSWAQKNNTGWAIQYNAQDTLVKILGEPEESGVSCRNRLRKGIIDWVGSNKESIVMAIGQGTTSTNNLAPFHNGEAYWGSSITQGFTSSTYYINELPEWVVNFNIISQKTFYDSSWNSTIPSVIDTIRDDYGHENNGKNYTFPHNFLTESGNSKDPVVFYDWLMSTPKYDKIILEFAKTAVIKKQLGKDDVVDFLSINLSSLDDIGHRFGPQSRELEDALLKLDQELLSFINFLDESIGKGNYVLALTGDHGCAPVPESIKDNKNRRITVAEIRNLLGHIVELNNNNLSKSFEQRSKIIADTLKKISFIEDTYSFEQLSSKVKSDDPYLELYKNSFMTERIPCFPLAGRQSVALFGVMVRFKSYHIPDYAAGVHGSPYNYDRAVPLFFFGSGIPAKHFDQIVRSVDVAPTIAKILNIGIPEYVDGKALID